MRGTLFTPLKRVLLAISIAMIATTVFSAEAAAARLHVVASFSIIGDIAKAIGKDRVELKVLVGPNSDAHVYEPKPSDAMALARADVVLVNGLLLEGFMPRLVEASGTSATVTVLTDGADILNDPSGGHYHFNNGRAVFHATPNDPHAWQSVANVKVYVSNIARAFCMADDEGCKTYEENAVAYKAELNDLDNDIRQAIAGVTQDRRVAVVAHNAFRYFERDYGVTFLAPQGVSTESQASAADVAAIIHEIREKRAVAVFAENISDDRLVKQIASEAGLEVSGVLYSDALSPPEGPAPSYIEMMRHNLMTITKALHSD